MLEKLAEADILQIFHLYLWKAGDLQVGVELAFKTEHKSAKVLTIRGTFCTRKEGVHPEIGYQEKREARGLNNTTQQKGRTGTYPLTLPHRLYPFNCLGGPKTTYY